ncbi:MAG: peptide deformylase [Planctomycetota bacterium]|jgi:peptide deformylase
MDVLKYPHPSLQEEAREIGAVDEEVRELAAEMLRTMYASRGIGLAAPQVGISRRLIVINLAADPDEGEEIVLINPILLERGPEMSEEEEGCLSLPGLTGVVPRWKQVRVQGFDSEGKDKIIEAEGLLSRVLQHEMDHLDGLLFISKLSPVDRVAIKPKLRELKAKAL